MTTRPNPDGGLARIAAMIGEPARATMLDALLGGEALPAGELARRADVAPGTASAHLTRLVNGGLLVRRQQGRHRYFSLANGEVAAALEALGRIVPVRPPQTGVAATNGSLRFARTCYDHLAGVLGVSVTEQLVERGFLRGRDGFELTPAGGDWLGTLGVDVAELRRGRRVIARPCLDWTERRNHLAGAAGGAIATALLDRRWLTRMDGTRAVRLTLRGKEGLRRVLGLQIDA